MIFMQINITPHRPETVNLAIKMFGSDTDPRPDVEVLYHLAVIYPESRHSICTYLEKAFSDSAQLKFLKSARAVHGCIFRLAKLDGDLRPYLRIEQARQLEDSVPTKAIKHRVLKPKPKPKMGKKTRGKIKRLFALRAERNNLSFSGACDQLQMEPRTVEGHFPDVQEWWQDDGFWQNWQESVKL